MDPEQLETTLRILLYFMMLLMSGFFSGSETALFSLSTVQLMKFEERGLPRAQLVKQLLSQPRRLIATIFIGNEFVNIGASALMASMANTYLRGQGQVVVTLVSTAISVTLILFIGEITAKNLAVKLSERWARAAARPLWLAALLMTPLRWVIEKIADLVVRLVSSGEDEAAAGETVGEDEFLTMVDVVQEEGQLDAQERELIHNIFKFGDRRVHEVMTPAREVFTLRHNTPLDAALDQVRANKFSRVPVIHGSRDRIEGVIYAKDLLRVAYGIDRRPRRLRELVHPGYFVPRKVRCEQLFREFRRRMTHLALVVDEYGHLVGLVTMEDLLEELFGEITDEKELDPPTAELSPEDI